MSEIRIYVGTYAKYNAGSIEGGWIDLDGHDAETFREACLELHADEADPELMFHDFEGFPRAFYSESALDDRLWDWLELDDSDRETVSAYLQHVNQKGDIEEAREAYCGSYDSEADWAEDLLTESGQLSEVPEGLRYYIDFESYAHDAQLNGDITFVHDGGKVLVFHNT